MTSGAVDPYADLRARLKELVRGSDARLRDVGEWAAKSRRWSREFGSSPVGASTISELISGVRRAPRLRTVLAVACGCEMFANPSKEHDIDASKWDFWVTLHEAASDADQVLNGRRRKSIERLEQEQERLRLEIDEQAAQITDLEAALERERRRPRSSERVEALTRELQAALQTLGSATVELYSVETQLMRMRVVYDRLRGEPVVDERSADGEDSDRAAATAGADRARVESAVAAAIKRLGLAVPEIAAAQQGVHAAVDILDAVSDRQSMDNVFGYVAAAEQQLSNGLGATHGALEGVRHHAESLNAVVRSAIEQLAAIEYAHQAIQNVRQAQSSLAVLSGVTDRTGAEVLTSGVRVRQLLSEAVESVETMHVLLKQYLARIQLD